MNKPIVNVRWRHRNAVVLAVALLSGVAAFAAPRGTDEAVRGTGKSGAEETRLVTGDPTQINAVVAGSPPTAILAITPVQPPAAAKPVNSYPPGCTIVGQELRCDRSDTAGFRAWFNMQVSGWDPAGDGPNAIAYQVKFESIGYYQSDCLDVNPNGECSGGLRDGQYCSSHFDCPGGVCSLDLNHAVVPCSNATICRDTFGESFAKCSYGYCDAGYIDADGTGRPDSWCAPDDGGCSVAFVSLIGGPTFAAVAAAATGRPDGGIVYHGGTLVLDIPAGAKGKYTVQLNRDGTFIASPGTPPTELRSLVESGFIVNLVTGSCCFGLGTADAGCVDGCITRSDCEVLPGPRVFTPGATCANPPTDDGCGIPGTGACCDMSLQGGDCRSRVLPEDCDTSNPEVRWYKDLLCTTDGGTVDCINRGACCDRRIADALLRCRDGMPESQCIIDDPMQVSWTKETVCEDLVPMCTEHTGACCDMRIADDTLRCRDDVPESGCVIDDPDQVSWHKSTRCADLPEPCLEHTGACCDADPFGTCQDKVPASKCNCMKCLFYKDTTCSEIECTHNEIPTASEWGLVVLTLLLLTGAKILFARTHVARE